MMPMYMNSSQPGQMRPQGCYYQGFGNYPHHVTMDGSSPASCEHWPTPSPCYGSCIHGNFPSYTPYWPPCYPQQAPYHTCCGNHSGFHPHAPPYYTHQPFPGYQHGFESDDVSGKHRCTKCSPQMCYPKNDSSVVIEEHEPEVERGGHGGDVNHVRSTNCPYPIVWIPHEYGGNQEHGSHDQPPALIKAPESTKVQKGDPKSWNGCFPFDENTIKSLMQNQDRSKMQNGKTVELPFDISKLRSLLQSQEGQTQKIKEPGQLQYPIVWVPSQGKPEDVEASKKRERSNEGSGLKSFSPGHFNDGQISQGDRGNFDISKLKSLLQGQEGQTQKSKEPGQLQYPIVWIPSQGKQEGVEASKKKEPSNEGSGLKSFSSGHLNEGPISHGDKGNFEGNVLSDVEKKSLMRNIPVKSHLQEPRNIPVKLLENNLPEPTKRIAKTEPAEDTRKEQPSSPPKPSRLPPVCLRVDPLPKRKSGGSKSPSPPKRKEQTLKSEETKVASPLSSKKVETRPISEACNVKCEEANKEKKTCEERPNPTGTEKESVETEVNCEIVKPCESKENTKKPAKKTFAEEEAARIIQSRYRGYDVRRWEPIKKLKEIATVREQKGDVKKRIQALELSADQHTEGKEIVVLGEMVMNLLLKLDSVQGLHPSIRDHRKSLARELSDMQDYIDSLKKSSVEKEAVEEQVDNTSQTSDCPVNLEHRQLAEENKMVFDSEKVCPPPEEYLANLKNTTDGQLVAEAEEVTGLSETLAADPEPAAETGICEADSTSIPEKVEAIETVLPINPSSADGSDMTVTSIKEDKVMVKKLEEPLPELPQLVETTNATKVSETVSENEDRKGDDDYVLPSEKIETVETVLPVNPSSTDGNEMTVSKIDEDKVMVEKLEEQLHELPQVVETTRGPDFEGLEDATKVSETVANATENEDRKGEDDYVLSSEKIEAVETGLPVISSPADRNEMAVMVEKGMAEKLEEQLQEVPQVVETTHGLAFEGLEDATEVSETVANASENVDRQGDDDSVLPSEKDVEISEPPVGVIDDEMQLLSQDSSSCPPGVEKKTVMDPEAATNEETNVDQSCDHSSGISQETPQVTEVGMSEETKKLMEENQRYKEMMEMLVKAGREQLEVVSKLTGRVKSLEKKLSQKKRTHIGRRRPNRGKHATIPRSASYTDDVM